MKHPGLSFLSAMMILAALSTQAARGQICPLTFTPRSFPPTSPPSTTIGYQSAGYNKTGLLAPEPVPLGVSSVDGDRLDVLCGGRCYPFSVPGVWTGAWSRSAAGAARPGDFLNPTGFAVSTITDATNVLFLPPSAVAVGTSRVTTITVQLVDICSIAGFADPDGTVKFKSTTTRTADGKYDVSVVVDSVNIPNQSVPPCKIEPTVCELLYVTTQGVAPFATISGYPTAGMCRGELRMLQCTADDIDTFQAECGTPEGYDPVESHFGAQDICDRLTYSWSVIAGPGSGVFLAQGRSALFRATDPGSVTVMVVVTATDGETTSDQRTFTIEPLRVDRMDWKNSQTIVRDVDGQPYGTPSWEDQNNDGDAADPQEHRFPAAYTASAFVEIGKVFVDCTTHAPAYGIVRGSAPDQQKFKASVGTDTGATSAELVAKDLKADTALAVSVRRYHPYSIQWEVSFGDDYFVPAGSTDSPLYVTINAPATNYPMFESLFDISCKAADGSTSGTAASAAIWGEFTDRVVNRKPTDGFNVVDGKLLKYWPSTTVAPPNTLAGLLAHPDGWGQCYTFAQLYKACLEVHGLSGGTIYLIERNPSSPTLSGFLVKNWSVISGSSPYLIGSQIVDVAGAPAQGVANPLSQFNNHAFVIRGGRFYDPSYGTNGWPSVAAYEDASIDALFDDGVHAILQTVGAQDLIYSPTSL